MYDSDHEELKRLKEGEVVLCHIKKQRNYKFHKKFFALLRLTFDNIPEQVQEQYHINTLDDLLSHLKVQLGLYEIVKVNGNNTFSLGSISFQAMDGAEFEKFYNDCIEVITHTYLKGLDTDTIREEIHNFM